MKFKKHNLNTRKFSAMEKLKKKKKRNSHGRRWQLNEVGCYII